jgi:hypothetical protein
MDKKTGALPLLLVALLAGGALYPHLLENRSPAPAAAPGGSPTQAQTPPLAGLEAAKDRGTSALDLMAEFFGLDISDEGLKRAVRNAIGQLPQDDAISMVRKFFALDITKHARSLEVARAAANELAEWSDRRLSPPAPAVQDVISDFVDRYFNQDALKIEHPGNDEKLTALDFASLDKEPLALEVVRQAATAKNLQVRFLIATVPDVIDSHAGWQFDTIIEAIQAAAADSGYALDRFYFPDVGAEARARESDTAGHHDLHERTPGVILFRHVGERQLTSDKGKVDELLVVLAVPEVPTFGIQHAAFNRAISLIRQWDHPDMSNINVLGPTFSSSTVSLIIALQNLAPTLLLDSRVTFVSGSATSPLNKHLIETAIPGSCSVVGQHRVACPTFRATVLPDDVAISSLLDHIKRVNPNAARRTAMLVESNTAYGAYLRSALLQDGHKFQKPLPEVLPFPIHISRLRAEPTADRTGAPQAAPVPQRFHPLSLEELVTPVDQLPSPSFKTTSSYVELVLAGILDTIKRENIAAVGLWASDTRDKLFLAQQLATSCPNVTLFTSESDLLYTHPDYGAYMTGMAVASTYPLYNSNQLWSPPFWGFAERRQFPTSASQGIYNAALALIDYESDGSPRYVESRPLLEYAPPGGSCAKGCSPPVWLSAPSGGTIWPIKTVDSSDENFYLFRPRFPDALLDASTQTTFPSTGSLIVFILLSVGIAFHAVVPSRLATQSLPNRLTQWVERCRKRDPVRFRGYSFVCILTLLLPFGFLAATLSIWLGSGSSGFPMWAMVGGGGLIAALSVWSLVRIGVPAWFGAKVRELPRLLRDGLNGMRVWIKADRAAALASAFVFVLFGWGTWNLIRYFWILNPSDRTNNILFVERAANLGSGSSPAVPVLLLSVGLYLWGLVELWRLSLPRASVVRTQSTLVSLIERCTAGGVGDLKCTFSSFDAPILKASYWTMLLVGTLSGLVMVFGFDPFLHSLITVEGPVFNRFVTSFVLLLEFLIALALVKFVYQWTVLRNVLHRLAWHPMVEAYSRVPDRLLPRHVFPRQPSLVELQIPVEHWGTLLGASAGPSGSDDSSGTELFQQFRDDLKQRSVWSESGTWTSIINHAGSLTTKLEQAGWRADASDASGERRLQLQEEFVAMPIVFAIRDMFARLSHDFLFTMGAILLVVCTQLLYSLQSKQFLMGIIWIDILVGVAMAITVLVQVERNAIIGRLASRTPGQISWDRDFVAKLLVYGAIPLIGLFATQFPEVGGALFRWLEPVQKALP